MKKFKPITKLSFKKPTGKKLLLLVVTLVVLVGSAVWGVVYFSSKNNTPPPKEDDAVKKMIQRAFSLVKKEGTVAQINGDQLIVEGFEGTFNITEETLVEKGADFIPTQAQNIKTGNKITFIYSTQDNSLTSVWIKNEK